MNYDRIYEYRFQGVDFKKKKIVWDEIAQFIYKKLKQPQVIIDPAAGLCEFINAVPCAEKWAVDMNDKFLDKYADKNIQKVTGNVLELDFKTDYYEGVFVSNFLEHLHSQEEVAVFLNKMYSSLKKGGRIAIIGPNFKYIHRQYFDFADHTVILSELGVAEHLYGVGFDKITIYPQFLPLSFRGGLPVNRFLVQMYLKMSFFWRFFGKQFLLIAEK